MPIKIFDGHNDVVQHLREYRRDGIDFLEPSTTGHLDLPRAQAGGMFGGFFALGVFAKYNAAEDLTVTETSYEVRMAAPLDPITTRKEITLQLSALRSLEQRSLGKIRIATTVDEIEQARRDHSFAIVLHMEGADTIDRELSHLSELYPLDAVRESNGIVGMNFSVGDVRPDGHRNPDTPLALVAEHIAYLVDRLGIDRVAIGSDFDGATIPAAIGDASGLPRLITALREHGFDDAALEKIASANWMRILRLTLRESPALPQTA